MKKLILASGSPNRKQILVDAGIDFEIDPSNYEEDMTLPMHPYELVKHLSEGKAKDVAVRYREGLVVGADSIVVFNEHLLGKPHTPERAKEMLKMLSGKSHEALTGFTVVDVEKNKIISKVVVTKVFFRNLSDAEIEAYVATGEPLERAGAYAIQENGVKFVEKIEGSKANVAGLPIEELLETLKEF